MNKMIIRYVLANFLIFMTSAMAYSQDLLITKEGDTLNCKITRIKDNNIYFTFKYKNEIRNTLLPFDKVSYYQYNYYQTTVVPQQAVRDREDYPRFKASVYGGWSYRTAKAASSLTQAQKDYIQKLRSGYFYGLDVSYYFFEQLGAGFLYEKNKSKSSDDNLYVTLPDGSSHRGINDNISTIFIGPYFSTRLLNNNKKNSLLLNLVIGYLGYEDDMAANNKYSLKGSTVGFKWIVGYDIGIVKNLALGFKLSYLTGLLTQYEFSDGNTTRTIKLDKNNYESLNRIEISVCVSFIK